MRATGVREASGEVFEVAEPGLQSPDHGGSVPTRLAGAKPVFPRSRRAPERARGSTSLSDLRVVIWGFNGTLIDDVALAGRRR